MPSRYRAAGAIEAWREARRGDGRPGAELEATLANPKNDRFAYVMETRLLVLANAHKKWQARSASFIDGVVAASVPNVAFWLRKGVLYEPSQALEQMLKATQIATDIPLAALAPTERTICIVPGQELRHVCGGVDSIILFEHTGEPAMSANERWLTFVVSKAYKPGEQYRGAPVLRIRVDDESMTIHQSIEKYCRVPCGDQAADDAVNFGDHAFWSQLLSYSLKILCYLSIENPVIVQDAAYSNAPREMSGLGKRKRRNDFWRSSSSTIAT